MTHEAPPANYAADPSLVQPVGRNIKERKHLATLERRAEYIRERLETQNYAPAARDYRAGERAALLWALARIAEIEQCAPRLAIIADLARDYEVFIRAAGVQNELTVDAVSDDTVFATDPETDTAYHIEPGRVTSIRAEAE